MKFIVIIIIIVGLIWYFSSDEPKYNTYPSSSGGSFSSSKNCMDPENPYSTGSGHYAGFEWGENGNSCGGNSDSFIEGCEEYLIQLEDYDNCGNK